MLQYHCPVASPPTVSTAPPPATPAIMGTMLASDGAGVASKRATWITGLLVEVVVSFGKLSASAVAALFIELVVVVCGSVSDRLCWAVAETAAVVVVGGAFEEEDVPAPVALVGATVLEFAVVVTMVLECVVVVDLVLVLVDMALEADVLVATVLVIGSSVLVVVVLVVRVLVVLVLMVVLAVVSIVVFVVMMVVLVVVLVVVLAVVVVIVVLVLVVVFVVMVVLVVVVVFVVLVVFVAAHMSGSVLGNV